MLAEHTFITTMELDEARDFTIRYLEYLDFHIETVEDGRLTAVRGLAKARSRLLSKLPQKFKWEFDRGRITVAASVTPRHDKSLSLYTPWLLALVVGLEFLLTRETDIPTAAEKFQVIEQNTNKIWFTSEKVGIGCLVVILLFFIIMIVALIVAD